jgi:copper chaperone CopZ
MGRKALTVYLTTITLGAILFGLFTNWLIPVDFILSKVPHLHPGHNHEMVPYWLQLLSAVVLILSMAGGYIYKKYKRKNTMKQDEGTSISVEGMTCSHCEANVKRNLEKIRGIERVEADNSANRVVIFGKGYDSGRVKKTVEELGYNYLG